MRLDVLLEHLVELELAGRHGGRVERRVGRFELELLAVKALARRDLETHLDRSLVERTRAGLEGDLRIEKVVSCMRHPAP